MTSDDVLTRYQQAREAGRRLHSVLMRHISRKALLGCARKLGLTSDRKSLFFENESETNVLMDYCIYDHLEPFGGARRNAIERHLILSSPPEGSEERALLESSLRARHGIFVVTDVFDGLGLEVQDILRRGVVQVVDIGFSRSARAGMLFAMRLVERDGITMTTGAALPMDRSTLGDVLAELEDLVGAEALGSPDALTRSQKARVSAAVIRACLDAGGSSRVLYEDVIAEPSARDTAALPPGQLDPRARS